MPPSPLPVSDWHRVQLLLKEERQRLLRLTRAVATGADHRAEIAEVRLHIEALRDLAEAVRARMAADGQTLPDGGGFLRSEHSVLVVDDHEPTRYTISRALRANGYQTIEASAGASALELSEFSSAVVLDVQLPDLHGFEVCRLLRQERRTSGLPIVHVSAVHRSHADFEASRTAGADDFLLCPIDFGLLTQRLDGLLCARA